MKQINVHFEDADFKRLKKAKKESKLSWEKFILQLADEQFGVDAE